MKAALKRVAKSSEEEEDLSDKIYRRSKQRRLIIRVITE
jgi:hypothetical protein